MLASSVSVEAETLLAQTRPSDLAGPSSSTERGSNEVSVAHPTVDTHTRPTRERRLPSHLKDIFATML